MSLLLTPIQVGDLNLPNRVIMAPLTRCRASEGRVPNPLMAEYYAQRASAGLILTEATSVMPMGVGYPDTPGIWSAEQIEGWKRVTQAVHAAGGRIFMQLWHVGRVSHPDYLGGALPVAPSALAPEGHVSLLRPKRDYVVPRALETEEIPAIVEAYRQGAINAKAALTAMPPLVKGYLRLGAKFGEGCVVDHDFGTTDVFVVLPISAISERYITYYGGAS